MLNACAQSVYQVLFPSLGCATSCQNSSLTEGLCFLLFLLTGYSRYSQCKRKENETICTKIVKNIPYGYVWHSRGHRHLQASLSTTDSKYSKLCSVYGNVALKGKGHHQYFSIWAEALSSNWTYLRWSSYDLRAKRQEEEHQNCPSISSGKICKLRAGLHNRFLFGSCWATGGKLLYAYQRTTVMCYKTVHAQIAGLVDYGPEGSTHW